MHLHSRAALSDSCCLGKMVEDFHVPPQRHRPCQETTAQTIQYTATPNGPLPGDEPVVSTLSLAMHAHRAATALLNFLVAAEGRRPCTLLFTHSANRFRQNDQSETGSSAYVSRIVSGSEFLNTATTCLYCGYGSGLRSTVMPRRFMTLIEA